MLHSPEVTHAQRIEMNPNVMCLPDSITGIYRPVLEVSPTGLPVGSELAYIIEGIDSDFARSFPLSELNRRPELAGRIPLMLLVNNQSYIIGITKIASMDYSRQELRLGQFLHIEELSATNCELHNLPPGREVKLPDSITA